jgi:mRNA interferase MazF
MPGAVQQGDVYWQVLAENKRRPVLVMSRNSAIEFLEEVVVAPLTRTILKVPSFVGFEDGKLGEVAVNLDVLYTVSKRELEGFITRLSKEKLREVREAIGFSLGFDDLEDEL